MTIWLSIAIFMHFAWHLIATVGVLYSLYHSNKVHGHSKWKLAGAVIWTLVSLFILVELFIHGH